MLCITRRTNISESAIIQFLLIMLALRSDLTDRMRSHRSQLLAVRYARRDNLIIFVIGQRREYKEFRINLGNIRE